MTPKLTLLISIAGAALVFAAPASAVFPTLDGGDTGYASKDGTNKLVIQSVQPDFWNYDQSGQRIANTSPGVTPQDLATLYSGTGTGTELSIQPTVASDSGSSVLRQAGIGVAMGIVLLFGLLLVMRHTRIRPFAH